MYHSPIFPRRDGAATFSIAARFDAGTPTLLAWVEHRDKRDEHWAVAGRFSNIIGSAVSALDVTGLKELTRLSWELSEALAGDVVKITFSEPLWRPG